MTTINTCDNLPRYNAALCVFRSIWSKKQVNCDIFHIEHEKNVLGKKPDVKITEIDVQKCTNVHLVHRTIDVDIEFEIPEYV